MLLYFDLINVIIIMIIIIITFANLEALHQWPRDMLGDTTNF